MKHLNGTEEMSLNHFIDSVEHRTSTLEAKLQTTTTKFSITQ